MQEIILKTNTQNSVIHCGKGAFEKFAPALRGQQLFIVTDSNVFKLYKELILSTFGGAPVFVLSAGERSKTTANLIKIIKAMAERGMKRNCRLIAFGGGVVGDIAGLAASLYMRGVHLTQIPTTLLSQVDSSVGGKTAVDFFNVKNLIGAFYQPEQVIVDPMFLTTLPAREIRCGLGEIIKYGALDAEILNKLSTAKCLKNLNFLGEITADCIKHKAKVVKEDERDISGARKTLNLGHTTGHALELFYRKRSHGEFVLIGMYHELYIAKALKIADEEYCGKLLSLIKKVIKVPFYDGIGRAAEFALFDKKNVKSNEISLIVPKKEGQCTEIFLNKDEYTRYLEESNRGVL